MNNELHPAPGAGSTSPTNPNLPATAKLFANLSGELLFIASDNPHVAASDGAAILEGVERRLHQYTGPLDPDSFRQWASAVIIQSRDFSVFMREHARTVKKGLWRVLRDCTDLGLNDRVYGIEGPPENLTVETLMADVWIWCWENIGCLVTPGTAKTSTRIYKRAYWTARAWKTEQLRSREKYTHLDEADRLQEGPDLRYGRRIHFDEDGPTKAPAVSAIATRHQSVDTWLTGLLADGPRSATEVKIAAKVQGYGRVQLEGAVERLGVTVKPSGFGKPWCWQLQSCINHSALNL